MEREVGQLHELTDEGLLAEYNRAYKAYMTLTKSSSVSDPDSISNFAAAKDELKQINNVLRKRGIKKP
jgi:hypothetical protein